MRLVKFILPMLFFCSVTCQAASNRAKAPEDPTPKIEYNHIKDLSSVTAPRIDLVPRPSMLSVSTFYSFRGTGSQRPDHVSVMFSEIHDSLRWNDEKIIYIRHGDTRSQYPFLVAPEALNGGLWAEFAIVRVPADEFINMANSDAVYFQIGSTTDVLEGKYLDPWKSLAKLIPVQSKDDEKN